MCGYKRAEGKKKTIARSLRPAKLSYEEETLKSRGEQWGSLPQDLPMGNTYGSPAGRGKDAEVRATTRVNTEVSADGFSVCKSDVPV